MGRCLIGMDMVRLALERCKTSKEALMCIIKLLEEYGQGGNCGYEKQFTYHNSFLIADSNSAWVLETAGIYWAAQEVKDVRSISNCLSIGRDFDLCHPDLIKHAVDKAGVRERKISTLPDAIPNPYLLILADQKPGWPPVLNPGAKQGKITVDTMKDILRSHEDRIDATPLKEAPLRVYACTPVLFLATMQLAAI